jgi:hypothetical protein
MSSEQLEWLGNKPTNEYIDVKTDCHDLGTTLLSSWDEILGQRSSVPEQQESTNRLAISML